MEQDEDLSDAIFDHMNMPDVAERRRCLDVCHNTFDTASHKTLNNDDWMAFVSLLLQLGFVELHNNDYHFELENRVGVGTVIGGNWHFSTDEHGRIHRLHLRPRNALSDIPVVINRLDHLKKLYITGQHVKFLLLKEISFLPQLQELRMVLNTTSLKVIATPIRSDESRIASKSSLHNVHFLEDNSWGERQLRRINEDTEIKTALLTFLNFFVTIDTIKFPRGIQIKSDDDWKYELIKNMVGRRILEGIRVEDRFSSLPLSVWPTILQRAQQKTDERFGAETVGNNFLLPAKATEICHLLREGPALIGRRVLVGNSDGCPPPPKRPPRMTTTTRDPLIR